MRIATSSHRNQTRKESDLPYISHPAMVALKLQKYDFDEEIIAAALVHDVLEDTDYSPEMFRTQLGEEVWKIVTAVTNETGMTWEEKKRAYIESVRMAGIGAKAVALADKVHNAESLLVAYSDQGTEVWKYFKAGRDMKLWFEDAMYAMYKETWDHPLVEEYGELVKKLHECK